MLNFLIFLGTTNTLPNISNQIEEAESIIPLLKIELFGISLGHYFAAFIFLLLGFIGQQVVSNIFKYHLAKLAKKTKTQIDDAVAQSLEKPAGLFALLFGFLLAGIALNIPPNEQLDVRALYFNIITTLFQINIAWMLLRLVDVFIVYLKSLSKKTDTTLDDELMPILRKTLKVFTCLIAAVLILQNLGYNVAGLIAGLGIGGLAIALAAQDILSNIFGSVVIFTDRPFRLGDWVVAGDVEGVVEGVGFRSTKIRTFAKTLVTVPNKKIADLSIDNFSRMPKRRIKMTVGVTYETSADQMEEALHQIRNILRTHPGVDQEFFLVYFTDFGESSLNILLYFFTVTTVWAEYLQVREEVNLAVMRALEGLGLEIAFPTRTVYLKNTGGEERSELLPPNL